MSDIKFEVVPPEVFPNQPLKDVEKSLVKATFSFTGTPPNLGPINFKLSASANGKIEAYNEASDKDEDKVLVSEPETDEGSSGSVNIPPQINLNNQSAWLKYRFEGKAGVSATAKVAPIGFKIDASKSIVFADYRVHDRNKNTIAAAAEDLPKIRFAVNPEDAFRLAEKEALFYQVRGEFSAGITLSWADVFTTAISSLASVLPNNQLLKLEISPALSVDFHVGVVDDFQLVLTKASATKVRIALKKSNASEVGLSAGFQVVAKFADEAQLKAMLDKIYEAVFGQTIDKVLQILNAPANQLNKLIANLSSPLKEIAQSIVGKLKLEDVVPQLKDLKERIEKIQKDIKGIFELAAKAKVELGFKYEYLRTRTRDTLLVIQLNKENFKKFHTDLMLCDFIDLLEFAKSNESLVEKYLHQDKLVRKQAWGITLGFLKWKIGGKDNKQLVKITQQDLQGDQRIAYRGLRGYDSEFFGKTDWAVDFKAEMNKFVRNPTACDFEYGLNFRTSFEDKVKAKDLRRMLDDALIWQVLTPGNVKEILKELEDGGLFNKNAQVSVELNIKDQTFKKLLAGVAGADNQSFANNAFAMAMPYNEQFPTRADQLGNRRAAYESLWKFYFENPDLEKSDYASKASSFIRSLTDLEDEQELALREKNAVFFDTFAQQILKNDGRVIRSHWLRFIEGLKTLNNAIGGCTQHKAIEDAFNAMSPFWSQSLFVRAAGAYLTKLAVNNGFISEINRSCSIIFADKTFTFGKSTQ